MELETLEYEERGHVAVVRLNRPEQHNSFNTVMQRELRDTWQAIKVNDDVRAVVLTAAGTKAFCTGIDRSDIPVTEEQFFFDPYTYDDPGKFIGPRSQELWKPVIAAVNGMAAGGGAQLALACDLVVLADNAKFIEVFVRRGIMPDAGGCYLLPRLVGLQRAKELMFLGEDCDAVTAERIGLANRVVPAADLDAATDELAAKFLTLPTRAIALTKRLTNRSFESSREQSFDDEALFQELITGTSDCQEGLAAFAERRTPQFRGW